MVPASHEQFTNHIRRRLIRMLADVRETIHCLHDPEDPCTIDDEDREPCEHCRLTWDIEEAEICLHSSQPTPSSN